jgi:DNA polymerase III subunit delta
MKKIYNNPKEIDKDIKGGKFYPVYFFYGENESLTREYEGKIVGAVLGEDGGGGLLHSTFYGGDDSIMEVINSAMTLPMLAVGGAKKMVVIRNSEKLTENDVERLNDYSQDPADSTVLVITARGVADQRGRKSPLKPPPGKLKGLLESTAIAVFNKMREGDIKQSVVRRFRDENKKVDPEVLNTIIEFLGDDSSAVEAVVEKLLIYLGDEQQLTINDVEDMIPNIKVNSVFEMSDALSVGDAGGAIRMINKMLVSGVSAFELLGIIRYHFVRLWGLKVITERGGDIQSEAKKLKIPSFALEKYTNQTKRISQESFREILKKLSELDTLLKSGSLKDKMVMDKMVLDIMAVLRRR